MQSQTELICDGCQKPFFKLDKFILHSKKRGDNKQFCSLRCVGLSQRTRTQHVCHVCKSSFDRPPSWRKSKSGHSFCSKSCACKWNNTHKTKGTRISKLETWMAKRLPQLYPNLEFHFNRKDAIESELDIYVPSLKLAFELNGIFHYEPIYGEEKLASIKSNDDRKFQACLERGIELCIIDSSRLKYFKDKNVIPFLQIIQDIINRKLRG